MKKIVATIIVATQLLVGGLFLVTLFTGKEVDKKVVVVENNNLSKMVDVVSGLYMDDFVSTINTQEVGVKEDEKQVEIEEEPVVISEPEITQPSVSDYQALDTYVGSLTGYGPNCPGCSGITRSGYDVRNTTTYNDSEYGEVRILAAGTLYDGAAEPLKLYSIVRVSNVPGMEPFIGIVLDRGGNVGFGKGTLFDLLFADESQALHKTDNVTFEILRYGNN